MILENYGGTFTAYSCQNLFPPLADKVADMVEKTGSVTYTVNESQISMHFHPWYIWQENSVTYIYFKVALKLEHKT